MQNLVFKNVHENSSFHSKVIEFWYSLNALPDGIDPYKRAKHLVYICLDSQNNVVAVSTGEPTSIALIQGKEFFNYRSLVHPSYRMPGLVDRLAVKSINFLEELFLARKTNCIGVITLIEDKRVIKMKRNAVYSATGLTLAGYTKSGAQIRLKYFKGAMI